MIKLPSLNALRAFEALSRHLSVTRAAEELCVTHAAVSQQIKLLENTLNVPLVNREGKRIQLTSEGKNYAVILSAAFNNIKQATIQLQKENDPKVLTIRIPPTFALRWFIPRMDQFQNKYPEIDLRISTAIKDIDFNHDNIDLAIYYGSEHFELLHQDFLFEDVIFPVCNSALLKQVPRKSKINLSSYKLIYVGAELRKNDWKKWLEAAELPEPNKSSRIYFQDTIQGLQAAEKGLGLAMAHEIFVADDIKSKNLIAPFDLRLRLANNYYLLFPKTSLNQLKIKKFRLWLLSEVDKKNK